MKISKINPSLTLEYLIKTRENLYLDRKRAKVSLQDLANEIASFANANGGVIVVGLTDNGLVEGFNPYGPQKLNECQKVALTYLNPTPIYECEIISITNQKNENDNILLFHIEPAMNYIVRNNKDEVYLRQGDSSIKLTHNQIRSLEYDRKERDFETEILLDTSIDDIDLDMMDIYKRKIQTDLSNEQILKARGFLKEKGGKLHLTKAGILLFGKNPTIYLTSARVRIIKFEGTNFQLGTDMNIIKDKTFDTCLYKQIEQAKDFISSQLREFTHLNQEGIFETVAEYPEFAWYEGLVNAITHRDYSNSGEYIIIKIFDDRLEINSPGRLGGFVTLETMRTKRYSSEITNISLNYGYAILENFIYKSLINAGLDPYFGVLHSLRSGKPSLVLDVMEEYRSFIVDRNIIKMKGKLEIVKKFETIKKEVAGEVIKSINKSVIYNGRSLSVESVIQRQIYKISAYLCGEKKYKSYIFRW